MIVVPILLFFTTQIIYAGKDAYAGMLLYKVIIANADPIHFVAQPEDSDLVPGTPVRLYTKNSFSLVARGTVQETTGAGVRASRRLAARATGKVKVSLTAVHAPGAIVPYPDMSGQRQALSSLAIGAPVMWDTVRLRVRLCASCKPLFFGGGGFSGRNNNTSKPVLALPVISLLALSKHHASTRLPLCTIIARFLAQVGVLCTVVVSTTVIRFRLFPPHAVSSPKEAVSLPHWTLCR